MSESTIQIGDQLEVFLLEQGFIGIGIYQGEEPFVDTPDLTTPKIVMSDGRVLYGYECSWFPRK